jgi:fatty acid synthase
MREFAYNLYNSVDMIDDAEDRFKHIYSEHPRRFGKISNLEKFDSSFFSLLPKTANFIDPQGRILLECAYEAILDAGVCPKTLMGSNCGVFVGCFNFDSLESWVFDQDVDGMALGG